jgi:hypothetical protein
LSRQTLCLGAVIWQYLRARERTGVHRVLGYSALLQEETDIDRQRDEPHHNDEGEHSQNDDLSAFLSVQTFELHLTFPSPNRGPSGDGHLYGN